MADVMVRSSSSLATNGGIVYTSRPNGRSHAPRRANSAVSRRISTGSFISTTPIAPSTRTSLTELALRSGSS